MQVNFSLVEDHLRGQHEFTSSVYATEHAVIIGWSVGLFNSLLPLKCTQKVLTSHIIVSSGNSTMLFHTIERTNIVKDNNLQLRGCC